MFGIIGSIAKAAAVVVDLPVALVADTVTLGGATTDRKKTYTESAVGRFVDNVIDITDPSK